MPTPAMIWFNITRRCQKVRGGRSGHIWEIYLKMWFRKWDSGSQKKSHPKATSAYEVYLGKLSLKYEWKRCFYPNPWFVVPNSFNKIYTVGGPFCGLFCGGPFCAFFGPPKMQKRDTHGFQKKMTKISDFVFFSWVIFL